MATQVQAVELRNRYALSDRQYLLWKEMLESRTGVTIAAARDRYARDQIVLRMEELSVQDPDVYFREVLETVAGAREWGVLLDRLLVKDTRFFRHRASFDYLHHWVLDYLGDAPESGSLSAWSVGCATGEEVYSLAMTLASAYTTAGREPRFGVVGTDVSREALAAARSGIYRQSALAGVDPAQRLRYFRPRGSQHYRVREELRRKAGFIEDNILDDSPPFADGVDIIFCHNLLIYFRRWRRRQAVKRLVSTLRPGGILVVGPGELSDWVPPGAARVTYPGVQAYKRTN